MADFGKQVAILTGKYKKRLRATARMSVQKTVDIAQKPRSKGGRMRIDTGFLRASIAANVGSMPSGESVGDNDVDFTGIPIAVTLITWEPADEKIYVGWTANYARPREFQDGFMRGATELWPQTVDAAVKQVKARI